MKDAIKVFLVGSDRWVLGVITARHGHNVVDADLTVGSATWPVEKIRRHVGGRPMHCTWV